MCFVFWNAHITYEPAHPGIYSVIMVRLKTNEELQVDDDDTLLDSEQKLLQADVASLTRQERRNRAKLLRKKQEKEIDNSLSKKERLQIAKEIERKERKALEKERMQQQLAAQEEAQRQKDLKRQRERELRKQEESKRIEEERQKEIAHNTFLSCDETTLSVDDWVTQVKTERCVLIDALAERYHTTRTNVERRIQELISEQRVSGICTGDGRFVYVSEDELRQLAHAVREKGIATKSDIATIMTNIIYQK